MRWRSDLAMMPDLVAALPPGTEVLDYSTPAPAAAASCAVVAVPARNEEAVVGRCLHALAGQGRPLEVALLLNNCEDGTAAAAMSAAASSGLRVSVLNVRLPAEAAHAGWARRLAMDLAAGLLLERGKPDGVILTTDADCAPLPGWLDASLAGLEAGADIVAGAIEPLPDEFPLLNEACRLRADLVRDYIYLLDRLATLIDPEPHDPWPRHPFGCGASLALRLGTYLGIGGLPPLPSGEDKALVAAVLRQGGRVRHAVQARVATSCRTQGRARGGMADTLVRWSGEGPPNPAWDEVDEAISVARTLALRARLRAAHAGGGPAPAALAERLGLSRLELTARLREPVFARVAEEVPALCPVRVPADRLSGEIAIARALVARHQRRLGIQPAEEIEPVALVA